LKFVQLEFKSRRIILTKAKQVLNTVMEQLKRKGAEGAEATGRKKGAK
jgi:hypothetical protein